MAWGSSMRRPSRPLPSGSWPIDSTVASSIPTWMNCSRPAPSGAMTPRAPYCACASSTAASMMRRSTVVTSRSLAIARFALSSPPSRSCTSSTLRARSTSCSRSWSRPTSGPPCWVGPPSVTPGRYSLRSGRQRTVAGRPPDHAHRTAGAVEHVVRPTRAASPRRPAVHVSRRPPRTRRPTRRPRACAAPSSTDPSPEVRRGAPRGRRPPRRPRPGGRPRGRCRGARPRAASAPLGLPAGEVERRGPAGRRAPSDPDDDAAVMQGPAGSRTTTTGHGAWPAARWPGRPTRSPARP